jgi:Dictyostelium (slime mold) repeat
MRRSWIAWTCGLVVFAALGSESLYADHGHGSCRRSPKKVTLCHMPPGHPDRANTISVGEAAVRAHLRHGDHLGPCPNGCGGDPAACDDGNACTSDTCGVDGACVHEAVSCDDGDPCSIDLCQEETGCFAVAAPDGTWCDDGNTCTGADSCLAGSCRGDAIGGCCEVNADCDDLDPCTVDSCGEGGCTNEPRDCSVADKCQAGFCGADGECASVPVSCDDGNVCTDDSCDPVVGCSHFPTLHPPEAIETSCNDGADNDCDGLIDGEDSDCGFCGDGVAQAPEECDGEDFAGQTCETIIGPGSEGILVCTPTCQIHHGCSTGDGID